MPKPIKSHLRILDIDLDFFLNQKRTYPDQNRADSIEYIPWQVKKVRSFLEKNCGLSKENPIRGKSFITHDEVFYYLRQLQEVTEHVLTFSLDHVDAHADLGEGDSSYAYIATELLAWPVIDRCFPSKIRGQQGLSEGNFLLFMIACRWLTDLNYVNHYGWTNDIPWFAFRKFNLNSKYIQLKHFSADQFDWFMNGDMMARAKGTKPLSIEPKVRFKRTNATRFKGDGKYDLVLLTQSPQYTPETADMLIPVITEYIDLI